MKQTIIIFLFCFFSLNLSADMGYCYKYKISYKLKDSDLNTGYLIYFVQDQYFGSIKSLDTLLNRIQLPYQDSLTIYSEIYKLDSIRIDNSIHGVYVTPKTKVKKVCSLDIITLEIIEIEDCCSPLLELGNDKYYIERCCIPILTELTQMEIKRIQNNRPILSFSYRDCPDEVLLNLIIISFNSSLLKKDIENEISDLYCKLGRETSKKGIEMYKEIKERFHKKDIIIFKNCF